MLSSTTLSGPYLEILQHLALILPHPTASITLILVLCLVIQLFAKVSVIRGLYCSLITASLATLGILGTVFLLLLTISIILECIRTSDWCFTTKSIFAEGNNSLKVLHFLVVGCIVACYASLGTQLLWANCLVAVASLVLFAVRWKAHAYSTLYARLSEAVYFPLLTNSLLNIVFAGGRL